jgi:hypothetical protein
MKKTVKKLWLADLRSGKIKQAKSQLRNGDKRCCLGVLCDIFRRVKKKGRWNRAFDSPNGEPPRFLGEAGVLPDEVAKWAGLAAPDPFVNYKKADPFTGKMLELNSLSYINDTGYSFNQIADIIEKEL